MIIIFTIPFAGILNAQNMKVKGLLYKDMKLVEIVVKDGFISGISPLKAKKHEDLPIIAPGFIDVQVNGYMGVGFTDYDGITVDDVRKATEGLWKEGVTTYLPTIITAPHEVTIANLKVLSEAIKDPVLGKSIPGFFLEGPYISPVDGYRGAHPKQYVRPPDWNEFQQFMQASGDHIIKITIAPEIEGAMDFIDKCVGKGVAVAMGHHNANSEQVHEAARRGVRISTHLGNGCANMIHRHNNPLWPQMADGRLIPTIIADGFHLTADELTTFYKVKGTDNLLIISDITELAGLPPGEYMWNGKKVLLAPSGKLRMPDQDVLAGASFSIRKGVGNIMKFTGCSLEEAVQMSSTNQAGLFGWSDRGEVAEGKRADLVLFELENGEVKVRQTILAGEVVYDGK